MGSQGMTGGEYHALTVLHTAPATGDTASSSSSGVSSTGGSGGDYDPSTEYKICREASQTADFPLVVQAIAARLEVHAHSCASDSSFFPPSLSFSCLTQCRSIAIAIFPCLTICD